MARKRTMTKEQAKKRASQLAMEWDDKHDLIPIKIKTTPEKALQFRDLCDKYHISRREVMDELIKEYIDGDIDASNKESYVQIPLKVNHTQYIKMSERSKKAKMTKTNVFANLLDAFLEDPIRVLTRKGINVSDRPEELLNTLRRKQAKQPGQPLHTTDVDDYQAYASCFGTWATALYACGSLRYKEFTDYRKRSTSKFNQRELLWILRVRKSQLDREDVAINEKTFPYPGIDVYESFFDCRFEELLEEMKD